MDAYYISVETTEPYVDYNPSPANDDKCPLAYQIAYLGNTGDVTRSRGIGTPPDTMCVGISTNNIQRVLDLVFANIDRIGYFSYRRYFSVDPETGQEQASPLKERIRERLDAIRTPTHPAADQEE